MFDSVVGQLKTYEKRWIVDIDNDGGLYLEKIRSIVNSVRPEGDKIEAVIPTRSGYHLITKRFDVVEFNRILSETEDTLVDIQRKNPTLLYYPSSLPAKNNTTYQVA